MPSADYREFLASKLPRPVVSGVECRETHASLFDFQQAVVRWALSLLEAMA